MSVIKIMIVDDHHLVRVGIKSYFVNEPDLAVIGEASDGEQAVRLAGTLNPDLVLLDISMPNLNGMEAASIIVKNYPEIKIIILSMYLDEKFIQKCMEEGVHGYIHKGAEQYELIYGIRSVMNGELYYSKEVREVLVKTYAKNLRKKKDNLKKDNIALTKREKEIIKYIIKGLTSTEIGEKLFISNRTVDTHRANLMQKLKVKNVIELVNKVNSESLIEE